MTAGPKVRLRDAIERCLDGLITVQIGLIRELEASGSIDTTRLAAVLEQSAEGKSELASMIVTGVVEQIRARVESRSPSEMN